MRALPARSGHVVSLCAFLALGAACGTEAEGPSEVTAASAGPGSGGEGPGTAPDDGAQPPGAATAAETPPPPRDDSAELRLLHGLTAALAARNLAGLQDILAPELLAELRQLHDLDPADFWARGALWSEGAASGLVLVARQSSDGFPRWRGLVRFGSGAEESVTFGRYDGRVLLAGL
jgi:hypothetical protein